MLAIDGIDGGKTSTSTSVLVLQPVLRAFVCTHWYSYEAYFHDSYVYSYSRKFYGDSLGKN